MQYSVKLLPPKKDLETKPILKRLASAHRYLAELKGKAATIPNENILINTLALQEAKDSSAIENIITTHDELYKALLFENLFSNASAKEVNRYADALKLGFALVREKKIITQNHILTIQRTLEQNDAGYRRLPGTALINEVTGETVYTPPQDYDSISRLMNNLVDFINDDKLSDVDALIKMALLHFQFETIHPFYDGNGRTGRILNILYLVQQELLDLPILYLSRFIIQRKGDYYRLLQEVRDKENWEAWILYMLEGVEQTAKQTIRIIEEIRVLMQEYKHRIRNDLKKIYSQDLLNNLFKHPYTKIEFVMEELDVTRLTATRYLNLLVEKGFLKKQKIGVSNFYINEPLYQLFKDGKMIKQKAEPIKTVNRGNE
ncbi:MAG: Fic family protein [Bacteroidota bacterium]